MLPIKKEDTWEMHKYKKIETPCVICRNKEIFTNGYSKLSRSFQQPICTKCEQVTYLKCYDCNWEGSLEDSIIEYLVSFPEVSWGPSEDLVHHCPKCLRMLSHTLLSIC